MASDAALEQGLARLDDALEAGDVERAEKALQPLERTHARDAHVLVARARIQGARGDLNGARKLLEDVVNKHPLLPVPMAYLGQILAGQEQWALARPRLEKALQLGVDKPSVRHALGVVLSRLGRPADAVVHLQKAHAAKKADPDIAIQLAAALDDAGKAAEAERVLVELRDALKDAPNAHMLLANFQMSHGNLAGAVTTLDGAIARFPKELDLLRAKATMLSRQGRHADVAAVVRSIPEKDRNAEDWAFISTMALQEKKPRDALKAAQAAVKADPQWWRSHQSLGLALEEAAPSDGDAIINAYQEAIRLGDPEGLAGTRLGFLLLTVNNEENTAEAIRVLESTRQRAGDHPATLWNLSLAYARKKDAAKVKQLCQAILGSGAPDDLKQQASELLAELPKIKK